MTSCPGCPPPWPSPPASWCPSTGSWSPREFAAHPELALAMMKYLARTVRLLSDQVDQMAFRPAQWRVARYLTVLADGNDRSPVQPGRDRRLRLGQPGDRQPYPQSACPGGAYLPGLPLR
ncbi:MAG: hypothetical protein V8S86_05595, partial [Eubacteriales bacterium]